MSQVRLVPDELIEHAAICCDACVREWPKAADPVCPLDVWSLGGSGLDVLNLSSSVRDP